MFNANLLAPGEAEVSIAGNGRFGVTSEVELGSQLGLVLLLQSPNISLKYEMFKTSSFRTAFNAHIFYLAIDPTASSNADATTEAKPESESSATFMGYFGSVTTMAIDSRDYFSFGLYDFFLRQSSHKFNRISAVHAISPTVGFDKYLSSSWALTAALAYPVYILLHENSDLADMKAAISFLDSAPTAINPTMAFLTGTYSGETTNFEVGAFFVAGRGSPYANVFWRFN